MRASAADRRHGRLRGPTLGGVTDAPTPTEPPRAGRPAGNATALVGEAMTKSGILWVEVPGDRAWPVWHAWRGDTAYLVNGPGEQHLPWLPEEVTIILRSQDTGGRLLTVRARTSVLTDADPRWQPAVEALRAGRLNAPQDVVERWRAQCTVTALVPFGNLLEGPGSYDTASGASAVPETRATTATWRPWHWRGRPARRRGTG